jgi:hypothetical protein
MEGKPMTQQDLSKARNPDLRAAQLARKTAIQTNTEIVIVQNGKLVRISAEQLRAQQAGA